MKRSLLLILLAAALLLPLAGCSGGGSSDGSSVSSGPTADQTPAPATSPATEPVAITADYVIHMADLLPPDPGSAGDDTAEGVDANNNGVRDDIERWIVLEAAPNSAKIRAALLQEALALQKIQRGVESQETADAIEREISRAVGVEVAYYMGAINGPEGLDILRLTKQLEARHTDTAERVRRDATYERFLAGKIYPVNGNANDPSLFDIDPNLLPN